MLKIRQSDTFNFYESFSDLIFCTLVLFLVLVLFLALNVNRRIEDVQETEKTLSLKKTEVMQALKKLEIEKNRVQGVREKHKAKIERVKELEVEKARMVKLKEELKDEFKRFEELERQKTGIAKREKEVEKQIALITTRMEELEKEKLLLSYQEEKFKADNAEIERFKELRKTIQSKEADDNQAYETAGDDNNGGLVPCRWQYFVLLVVSPRGKMTFEGRAVTWKQLPGLLARVPNRKQTVLNVATTIASRRSPFDDKDTLPRNTLGRIAALSKQFSFESYGFVGIKRLRTKAKEPILVPIQKAKK